MPQPSAFRSLGIAKEATPGTAVSPTDFIPLSTIEPEDQLTFVDDTSLRGSMVDLYGTQAGSGQSVISMGGLVFADTFGYLLGGILGDVTTTGSSAPYTHAMSVDNSSTPQPTTFTFTHWKQDGGSTPADQYAGCLVDSVNFQWDPAGLLQHTSTAMGFLSAAVAKPSISYSTVQPTAVWRGVISIGGSGVSYVQAGEVDIKRAVSPILTVNASQSPYSIYGGAVSVTGKFTVVFESEAEATNFRGSTSRALDMVWDLGSGSTATEVKMHMTQATYVTGKLNFGSDYIAYDVTFKAGGNTTDAGTSGGLSNIKATIKSAKPANTYQ